MLTTRKKTRRESCSRLQHAKLRAIGLVLLVAIPCLARAQSAQLRPTVLTPAAQFAPLLVLTRTAFHQTSDRAIFAESFRAGAAQSSTQQRGGWRKWALIGGAVGATVGFFAWGASINHQNAPGGIILLPMYVGGGALVGAGVGVLTARR